MITPDEITEILEKNLRRVEETAERLSTYEKPPVSALAKLSHQINRTVENLRIAQSCGLHAAPVARTLFHDSRGGGSVIVITKDGIQSTVMTETKE